MPELTIRTSDGQVETVPIGTRPLKIGRSESCDIVLRNDGEVSREHAQVWLVDGRRLMVADLNSKNGTRVDSAEPFRNATRVAQKRVYIGGHVLELRTGDPDEVTVVTFSPEPPSTSGGTRYFPPSKRFDLNQQRLDLLINLAERLAGTFDRKQLLNQALDACCEALNFERGLIVLKTPRGEPEQPVARNMQRDQSGAYRVSRTLINRALIDGERAIVNNAATDLAGNISESLVRFPICSAMCVPIIHRDEILGVIYGDRVTTGTVYNAADVDFLAAIAQQVGLGLANLRMMQERARTEHILAELAQARTIQQMLLPPAPLTLGHVTVEGYNEPSSAVSGDYFDYFELGDDRLALIIADVTGHGLPSALMMANLQSAVRVAMSRDMRLDELAERMNRLVCRNTAADVFITAILARVDTRSGALEMVNAGHPGPLLFLDQPRIHPPDDNSLPLGIDPGESYVVQRLDPPPADGAIMFFTDGLHEASGAETRMLGLDPVIHSIEALPVKSTAAMIQAARTVVRNHLRGADHSDDLTLLALHMSA